MIKKILFIIVLSTLLISCGKKSDPIFKEPKTKINITKSKVVI